MPQFKRAAPAKKGDRPKSTQERVNQGFEVAEKGTKSWRDKNPTVGAMTESRGKKTVAARNKPKTTPKAATPKPKSKPTTPPKPKAKPAAKKVVRTAGGQRLKRDRFTGA